MVSRRTVRVITILFFFLLPITALWIVNVGEWNYQCRVMLDAVNKSAVTMNYAIPMGMPQYTTKNLPVFLSHEPVNATVYYGGLTGMPKDTTNNQYDTFYFVGAPPKEIHIFIGRC